MTLQVPGPLPRAHRPQESARRNLSGARITAPRLLLAPPTEADVDAIIEAFRDQSIQSWLFIPQPFTRADAERFVREVIPRGLANGTDAVFGFRLRHGGPLLGMVSVTGITAPGTPDGVTAEIGCWSAPGARRSRYATEAILAAGRWAFETLVCVGNQAAIEAARRIGFTVEGILRSRRILHGARVDMWVGSLLPADLERRTSGAGSDSSMEMTRY